MSFKKSSVKSSIKDAIIEIKEIEQYAIDSAKKSIEEAIAPQIEKAVIDTMREIEAGTFSSEENSPVVEEGIKLDIAPDADLTINVTADGASVEIGGDTSSIENSNPETEMTNSPEEEMFEIEGLREEDQMPAPAMDGAAPAVDGAMAPEETVGEPAADGGLSQIKNDLQDMASKIDTILASVNPEAAGAENGSEGEVSIVDDEAGANPMGGAPAAPAPAAPAPAAPNVPVNEDDIMFELEDDIMSGIFETDVVTEDSLDEFDLSSLDEIEIVDENEDENEEAMVDEIRGVSHTAKRQASNRETFINNKLNHAPVTALKESAELAQLAEGIENIKAQYESKIDELIQENASLKGAVKEYKDSFVELRQQVNEMQVFNGKLAYANRLLTTAGITSAEKIRIADEFDKVETIEEAKKLYNKLLSDMKSTTLNESANPLSKLKSTAKPSAEKSEADKNAESQAETLYESPERKRMRDLMMYASKKS